MENRQPCISPAHSIGHTIASSRTRVASDREQRSLDMAREHIDVDIRHITSGATPPLQDKTYDFEMFPVCSPVLLRRSAPIRTTRDGANGAYSFAAAQRVADDCNGRSAGDDRRAVLCTQGSGEVAWDVLRARIWTNACRARSTSRSAALRSNVSASTG